jgi:signal recognition particle subunit SRP72
MSRRIFDSSPKIAKTDQLFDFQSDIILQDKRTLDIMCNKSKGVARSTEKLVKSKPAPTTSSSINSAAVLNAAAHARLGATETSGLTDSYNSKAALKAILPLLDRRPNDVGLLLTICQLYISSRNYAAATHLLEAFFKRFEQSGSSNDLEVRHAPGLVATLATLYYIQKRHANAKNELAKTAAYWQRNSKTPPKSLMVAAGTALLDGQNPQDLTSAGDLFASLRDREPSDPAAVAGMVAAYALNEPSKLSAELVESLPPVARLVSDIDAESLEEARVAVLTISVSTSQPKARPAADRKTDKPNKIRKSRMPKDFDPNKKVDPERWLPMRDRSYYRPKGKKGKKKAEGLTQGGPVVEEKAAESKPAGGAGGGQQKKKKGKKGGKW